MRDRLPSDELGLLDALRRRDEQAFRTLVERYHASLLRLALVYTRTRAVAEEVVQETWLGVLKGLEGFEGRSTFKTWLFRILVNRAKTRSEREGRTVPASALWDAATEPPEPALDASRFYPAGHPYAGHATQPLQSWGENPEERLVTQETLEVIRRAVDGLPPAQREVITLRDLEGWDATEVCNILGITSTNQRVLLHRARGRVRTALERYLGAGQGEKEGGHA